MKNITKLVSTLAVTLVGIIGCAAPDAQEDVVDETALDADGLSPQAAITVNGFTLNAVRPYTVRWVYGFPINYAYLVGGVDITGGTGTQKQGACLLKVPTVNNAFVTCNTVADCSGVSIPTGGARYCTNVDNVGQKYCATRGPSTASCVGSPANGGVAVGNGTYRTPEAMTFPGVYWLSYACVAGCTTTDPSVSSMLGGP